MPGIIDVWMQHPTLRFMQQLWKLVHALDVRSKRMAKTLGVTGPQRLVVRILGQSSMMTARGAKRSRASSASRLSIRRPLPSSR